MLSNMLPSNVIMIVWWHMWPSVTSTAERSMDQSTFLSHFSGLSANDRPDTFMVCHVCVSICCYGNGHMWHHMRYGTILPTRCRQCTMAAPMNQRLIYKYVFILLMRSKQNGSHRNCATLAPLYIFGGCDNITLSWFELCCLSLQRRHR